MVDVVTLFGFLGSLTAACLFFPQVIRSYRTKKTHDLEWFGVIIGMANGVFWTAYGLLRQDPFIYVTNSVLFIGAFLLMLLKRQHG